MGNAAPRQQGCLMLPLVLLPGLLRQQRRRQQQRVVVGVSSC